MQVVYWFSEISKDSLDIAGGKGANLGEMTKAGLPVPPGFLVSSDAYFEFVRNAGIDKLIAKETANLDAQDSNALNVASEKLKKAISSAQMPSNIGSEVVRAYNKLCGATLFPSPEQEVLVAVRSSATAEDLPEASFAGQQATFLNVKGANDLLDAVKDCWASLFESRAIYYRGENNFDNVKVGIAVVVQKMVESEKSGIMFTVDPVSQNANDLVIEGGFGLGEAVVSGAITPDRYVVDKSLGEIKEKKINRQEFMILKKRDKGNEHVEVPEEIKEVQKISESEVKELAHYGMLIEKHYGRPQDIEWAIEAGKVYIVQSRAITTLGKSRKNQVQTLAQENENSSQADQASRQFGQLGAVSVENAKILLQGMGASPGIASGKVTLIYDLKELYKVKNGDVLVTEMTTPDFVPAMKRAAAIVTDEGGSTCHASIVSRELGIPCIVGTKTATLDLKDGQIITVDAKRGVVYEGNVEIEKPAEKNQASSQAAAIGGAPIITGTKIYVNLAEPEIAEVNSEKNVDGVGLLRAEFMIAGLGKHPRAMLKQGKQEEFVTALAKGLRKTCAAFYPRPVVYRATDFKTNEYKNLEGGAEFEPKEENPMIGFRGCFRYVKDAEVFNMELEAIKRVRHDFGMKNLWLMIPFVRTVHEFEVCKELVEDSGLHKGYDFKLGIMCEVPSTVINAEEFCQAGAQFFSIGSNDLTQLTLGVDRDNPIVAEDFDERDPAVLKSIKRVIESCHKYNVPVSICGQAPSVYPEFAEALVEYGIDSISVNPDVIDVTRKIVASAEQRVMLKRLRELGQKSS